MPQLDHNIVWTVEMLEDLPDDGNRYEIVDGELLVSPMPSFAHQRAAHELGMILGPFARRSGVFEIFSSPISVTYSRTTEVQPDLTAVPLVNGRVATRFSDVGRLLLAVEVLSPSTARYDRFTKRRKYQEKGTPLYWMFDLEHRRVEVWRPGDEHPEIVSTSLTWQPEPGTETLTIDLPAFFRLVHGE